MELLQQLRDGLDRLANTIGLATESLAATERVDEIRFTNEMFPAKGLSILPFAVCKPLIDLCGDTLSLVVRFDAAIVLSVGPTTTEVDVANMCDEVREQSTVALDIFLDKDKLLTRWDISPPECVGHFFLFPERCEEILAGTIGEPSQLESFLWGGQQRGKCVLFVAGSKLLIDGPGVAVIGATHIAEKKILPDSVITSSHTAAIYKTCREVVRWDRPWLTHLTPHSLRVESVSNSSSKISQALFRHWANTCILFLADRVREEDQGYIGVFATEQRRAQVTLSKDAPNALLDFEQVMALGDIAEWVYGERHSGNRIRMAQAVVAQELSQLRQPVPIDTLIAQAPLIWRDLQWHWKTFISSEIERYTSEERELENEVSETVATFDGEVAEMIKSLTSTMLGAVGALIASLLAAAFKEPFNPFIFQAGVYAFLAYVVLFPGVFGMTHHVIRFRTIRRIFERRRDRYARDMGVERVQQIVGDAIDRAAKRFRRWFAATLVALIVVALLCIAAVWKVPSLVSSKPASGATVPRTTK